MPRAIRILLTHAVLTSALVSCGSGTPGSSGLSTNEGGSDGPTAPGHDASANTEFDAPSPDSSSAMGSPTGSDASFDANANPGSDAASPPVTDSGIDATPDADTDGGNDSGVTHSGIWRIMPLGDSITGEMCPPQLLSQQLIENDHTDFVFVGSNLNNQSCYGAPNVQTEGHGGYLVTDLVGNGIHAAELPEWCAADKADIVVMQFGTNDVWNSKSTASILAAYSVVLADLRAVNPKVILFIAQITPLNPAGCTNCEAGVVALNAQIPAWASSESTAASPVYVVDVFSAFDPTTYVPNSTDTVDGVHPDPAGSKLDADKWYNALVTQGLP